jgi:outer membrane protein assembly factor BamE (lipoprotein component of BamABCDE complex)
MRRPFTRYQGDNGGAGVGMAASAASAAGAPAAPQGHMTPRTPRYPRRASLAATGLVALALVACAETVTKHGHQFQESDLQQISPGMSQEQVKTSLGTPTTTAAVGGGTAFYYISSIEGQTSFFKPVEKDRKVLAVYFGPMGSVDRVAQYGLKDGKVFDYVKQETPSHARDESILKALFRNLGVKQLGLD